MSISRDGFMFDMFGGGATKEPSISLKRCPRKIDMVRFKALGHMGITFNNDYYGDEISWWELSSAGFSFGNNTVVKYPLLQVGWTYYYNAVDRFFHVTDEKGNTQTTKVTTIADLGITWEILTSHQFKIYFSGADFIGDAFLIAWYRRRGQPDPDNPDEVLPDDSIMNKSYLLSYVDQFFTEKLHWKCNRFVEKTNNTPSPENTIEQNLTEPHKLEILRPQVPVRSATGDYSAKAIISEKEKFAAANKKRNAIIDIVVGEFLMVAFFASIHNMSKPVYEPWMLFNMWKWLSKSDYVESIDKIFDLSPRW